MLETTAKTAQPLTEALSEFMNLLLRGECPAEVRPILFEGNMNKETESWRPIAVGYIWRRLAAKCASKYALSRFSHHFGRGSA